MDTLLKVSLRMHRVLTDALAPRQDRERGDVPGWVLITLMTAGIVAVLWTVAQDRLVALFNEALNSVRR